MIIIFQKCVKLVQVVLICENSFIETNRVINVYSKHNFKVMRKKLYPHQSFHLKSQSGWNFLFSEYTIKNRSYSVLFELSGFST